MNKDVFRKDFCNTAISIIQSVFILFYLTLNFMFQTIFYLITLLILFSILLAIVVGLFIGVTYLIIYFLPTVDLTSALIPAAILTMVPIITMGNIFKQLLNDNIYNSNEYLLDDEED